MRALQNFQIGYNSLSGSIPTQLMQIKTLESLGAAGNELTGTLPDLGIWPALVSFDVANNSLTGPIRMDLGALELELFDVVGNALSGTIADELCSLGAHSLDFDCSPELCGCNCSCRGRG